MTTAVVRELKRLSPHGTTVVVPLRPAQSMSVHGQSLAGARLVPDRGVAARDGWEPRR